MKSYLFSTSAYIFVLFTASCSRETAAREETIVTLEQKKAASMHQLVEPLATLPCPSFGSPSNTPQGEADLRLEKIAKSLWDRINQSTFDWSVSGTDAAKQLINDLMSLHKWLSKESGYGNVFLAGACEHALSKALVTGLMANNLSPAEVKSKLAAILAARLDRAAIGEFMTKALPESKMAGDFAKDLKRGKVSLVEASGILLREESNEHPLLLPQDPGEMLNQANPLRVLQYSAIGLNFLHWSSAAAEYVEAGGNLVSDEIALTADLEKRIPQFFKGKSEVTGEKSDPTSVVAMIKFWQVGDN